MVTRRAVMAGPAVAAAAMAGLPASATAVHAQSATSAQSPGFYRYRLGDMELTAVNDGTSTRPVEGFIPNAPAAELKKALEDAFLPTDTFTNTVTSLVVRAGSRVVLIDTGFADNGPPTTGRWTGNFQAAGFDSAGVTDIVISHFHPDHIGGIRRKDGTAVFPTAQIHVPEAEWAFWTDDARMAQAPDGWKPTFAATRRVFGPIMADVKRFAAGAEILPGVIAIAAHGHTPGHTAYMLASGGAKQIVMGDTANNPALFVRHPEWSAVFDMDAEVARQTRLRMLDMAAAERARVSFYHAPFPSAGHILKGADGYRFVPVQWSPSI